jgi:hypothetical protein
MLVNNDPETMHYYYTKTIENEKVIEANAKYWSFNLDKTLKSLVILFNFNFQEIAERLQSLMPKKIELLEEEIKRHWAFLHAARCLRMDVDDDYYRVTKEKFPDENIINIIKEVPKIAEKEEKIRLEKENEKFINERFNLISFKEDKKQPNEKK